MPGRSKNPSIFTLIYNGGGPESADVWLFVVCVSDRYLSFLIMTGAHAHSNKDDDDAQTQFGEGRRGGTFK